MLRDKSKDNIKITALDGGGFKLEVTNKNEPVMGGNYYGLISYDSIRNLEGRLLTIIDASIVDKEQRKALKDIIRKTVWFDWVDNNVYKGKQSIPTSMPITEMGTKLIQ